MRDNRPAPTNGTPKDGANLQEHHPDCISWLDQNDCDCAERARQDRIAVKYAIEHLEAGDIKAAKRLLEALVR